MARADAALQRWLDRLPSAVLRQLGGTIREEAEALSAAQRARLQGLLTPPEETGSLDASCRVEGGSSEAEVVVAAGGESTTKDGYDHALGFEFGTARQAARPFFYSTYRERRGRIRKKINAAIEEAIKKA